MNIVTQVRGDSNRCGCPLLALFSATCTRLSLDRMLPSRAYLRFTGHMLSTVCERSVPSAPLWFAQRNDSWPYCVYDRHGASIDSCLGRFLGSGIQPSGALKTKAWFFRSSSVWPSRWLLTLRCSLMAVRVMGPVAFWRSISTRSAKGAVRFACLPAAI